MTERADHDWPDEEGGPQAAAGLRGDTGLRADTAAGGENADPGHATPETSASVGAAQQGGAPTSPRGPEGYGDLAAATAGSAGSPESSGIKPGEGTHGSDAPA